jgi:hypothetical protein
VTSSWKNLRYLEYALARSQWSPSISMLADDAPFKGEVFRIVPVFPRDFLWHLAHVRLAIPCLGVERDEVRLVICPRVLEELGRCTEGIPRQDGMREVVVRD